MCFSELIHCFCFQQLGFTVSFFRVNKEHAPLERVSDSFTCDSTMPRKVNYGIDYQDDDDYEDYDDYDYDVESEKYG
jgi:hypothetical protein